MSFQVSNYQVVGQLLADLIRDAQAAVWQLENDDRRQAQNWLALDVPAHGRNGF
jgi:hypothetical protein